jgi:hypothetical protein
MNTNNNIRESGKQQSFDHDQATHSLRRQYQGIRWFLSKGYLLG